MKKIVAPLTSAKAKKELVKSFKSAIIHHFEPGEVIVKEGQISDCCFFVIKGRVQILRRVKRVHQVKLGVLGSGQFFGEMAMLSGERRSATAQALTKVEAIEIGRSEFEKLAQANDSLAGSIALHFSVQMASRINQLLKLLGKNGDLATQIADKPVDVRQVLHKVYSVWAV